ncbi:hypothetical protein KVR01_001838 [Diaporthe batatas]|uniref:uncharacterized protein n=1 Tax=Diaporthe batatas TaxID=748121 RepID=UPI001D058561|nr:uncharacterized protein KVR01_001838 [Diaporthe batatas]KAG8169089.1 hypothetical protein KVR01_001838 [Diaporthe batatas]
MAGTLVGTETVPLSIRVPRPSQRPSPSPITSEISTRRAPESRFQGGLHPSLRRDDHSIPPGQRPQNRRVPNPSETSSGNQSSVPEGPESSAVRMAGPDDGPSRDLVRLRSPSIRSEDDFIGVHSREPFQVVASPEERVEQGHIRYQDGEKIAVVAKIKPDQAFNFMTTFRASELGLLELVQPHEDGDGETWIMLPDGTRIQPHGTIQLRWYPRQSRSIPLQFLVLPRWSEAAIVLGARYVAKEEHYAKRRRDRTQ